MKYMVWVIVLISAFAALFYVLWIHGYLYIKSISTKFLMESSPKKRSSRIRFSSCSGTLRRVIRLKENENSYQFNYNETLKNGNVTVEIMNKKKETILTLNHNNVIGTVVSNKNERYYMRITFINASGMLEVEW